MSAKLYSNSDVLIGDMRELVRLSTATSPDMGEVGYALLTRAPVDA